MKETPPVEEQLEAMVDGRLTLTERDALSKRVARDGRLARLLCELNEGKTLVRSVYRNPPTPPGRKNRRSFRRRLLLPTVLALLTLIIVGGFSLFHGPGTVERFAVLDPGHGGRVPASANINETRIVVHVTNPDVVATGEILNELGQLLADHRRDGKWLRVELVAHGGGLRLLQSGVSRNPDRITKLAQEFPNLTFVACSNTIRRLEVAHGIEVTLIPEARETPSGIALVVRRQQEGWAYIRV
jgi:intracellular sulfur oxidation DsrE/DsrF family protein